MTDELEKQSPETAPDKTGENDGKGEPQNLELSTEMKTALAQKEHWRAKAEKLEADIKKLQEQKPSSQNGAPSIDPIELTRLSKVMSGYSEGETDLIIEIAKGKFGTVSPSPSQIIEASKNDWVQEAINSKRAKVAKEQEILPPSSKQQDVNRPRSLEETLENASLDESEKILAEKGLVRFPKRTQPKVVLKQGYEN